MSINVAVRQKTWIMLALMLLIGVSLVFSPAVASAHGADGFENGEEALMHMAEDLEEIHGDMHKVSYWLKIGGIGVWVLAGAVLIAAIPNFRRSK